MPDNTLTLKLVIDDPECGWTDHWNSTITFTSIHDLRTQLASRLDDLANHAYHNGVPVE